MSATIEQIEDMCHVALQDGEVGGDPLRAAEWLHEVVNVRTILQLCKMAKANRKAEEGGR